MYNSNMLPLPPQQVLRFYKIYKEEFIATNLPACKTQLHSEQFYKKKLPVLQDAFNFDMSKLDFIFV